jgi:hypothetical protein
LWLPEIYLMHKSLWFAWRSQCFGEACKSINYEDILLDHQETPHLIWSPLQTKSSVSINFDRNFFTRRFKGNSNCLKQKPSQGWQLSHLKPNSYVTLANLNLDSHKRNSQLRQWAQVQLLGWGMGSGASVLCIMVQLCHFWAANRLNYMQDSWVLLSRFPQNIYFCKNNLSPGACDPWLEMVGTHPDIRSDADIRWRFQRNCTSASPGGYPLAITGIRADIRGYPPHKWPLEWKMKVP